MNEVDYEKVLTVLVNHPDPTVQYATQNAVLLVQNQELMEQLALLGVENDERLDSILPGSDEDGTGGEEPDDSSRT